MAIPDALTPLFEAGAIERVLRPLMSGKEAQVFLVEARGLLAVAKVYKEAMNRSFKHRADYTEGRKTRNSRDQRAIAKRTQHGRAQDEAAWRSTEVDMIRRLHAGGVRVPTPYIFLDGVLVMECVVDADGNPAPRLGEISLPPDLARAAYDRVIREVVRMLALGVVHGDLSPFNVLYGADGPVIIDLPQSVDAAGNTNARRILLRDVDNMHRWLQSCFPGAGRRPYAEEMWDLYEAASLTADTRLTGTWAQKQRRSTGESVFDLVREAAADGPRPRGPHGSQGPHGPRGGPPRFGDRPRGPSGPPRPPQVYESRGTRTSSGSVMKLTPREPPPAPAKPQPQASPSQPQPKPLPQLPAQPQPQRPPQHERPQPQQRQPQPPQQRQPQPPQQRQPQPPRQHPQNPQQNQPRPQRTNDRRDGKPHDQRPQHTPRPPQGPPREPRKDDAPPRERRNSPQPPVEVIVRRRG